MSTANEPGTSSRKTTSRDLIERTRNKLTAAIRPLIEPGQPYALLDFPNHWNVGDSAIWAGEERLLSELSGQPPAYVATTDDFDDAACREAIGGGTIFLHGGGNFGDIYHRHQAFREHMLSRFCDARIVILPQTIKYRDEKKAAHAAAAIKAHPDAHLFVRDQASLNFAEARFDCPVALVPDTAFALGPLERTGATDCAVLLHMRRDVERVERDLTPLSAMTDVVQSDWHKEPRLLGRWVSARAELAGLLARQSPADRRVARMHALAAARVARGLALLSSAKRVVTDRLHGHILCTLLDVPHVALDNDYGKVHAYVAAWDADYEGVSLASSAQEAVAKLAEFRTAT